MGIELQEVQLLSKKASFSATSTVYKPNTMTARKLSSQPPPLLKREVTKMSSSVTLY